MIVTSTPDGADVYVDAKFVGNTPATLKLKSGSHNVRVSVPGRKDWERALEVLKDSQVTLKAQIPVSN